MFAASLKALIVRRSPEVTLFQVSGFLLDDLESSCARMEAEGVSFKKRPQEG